MEKKALRNREKTTLNPAKHNSTNEEGQKCNEKEPVESHHRSRSLIDHINEDIIIIDREYKITDVNKPFLSSTGYHRNDVIGKHCYEISHRYDKPCDNFGEDCQLQHVFTSGEPAKCIHEHIKQNGSKTWVDIRISPLTDPNGNITHAIESSREITDLIKVQDALHESEEKYRRIFNNSVVGFVQSTPQGDFISVNPAFAKMLGYKSPEEIVSSISNIATECYANPEDRHRFQQILQEWGYVENFEVQVKRKEGSLIWVSNSTRAYFDADGRVKFYEGIVLDITHRKQAEADRERLSGAIEQMGESVMITDPKGIIEYVNPSFEKLTGYSRHETIGQHSRILKSGHQDDDFYRELWETISSGNIWEGQFKNKRKDGTLFTEQATISPIFDPDGKVIHFIAVKKDITQQIRFDEEKVQLQEQLQQVQKVEAIGRLAGGVAHDFNNMLSIILGYSENIHDQLQAGDPLREDAKEIIDAGRRSAALTRQLLAFSRRQPLQPRVVNINDIISNLQKMLVRLIGEDIELDLMLSQNLKNIIADPGQIEQVIMNIVVNARDAMPRGGKLIIETSNVELDEAYANEHVSVVPGRYAMFAINDTGSGMDCDTLAQIFEPFFTTKEKSRGTGLGLSTVFGIVKQSGGNIWVYSEPGYGTTFKIYLPISDAELKMTKKGPEKRRLPSGDGRILVVEDEIAVQNILLKALSKYGYEIHMATNGNEAMQIVEEKGEELDLVITDAVMPSMGGSELIKRIKVNHPDLKVLLMSGYTDNIIAHHCVIDSEIPFISKPFSIREVITKVQELLR